MTELISIKDMPKHLKINILQELGYGSDGIFVLNENGEVHLDKYIDEPVKVDNMVILPGSTIVLDNNPLSISSYLEEFGDVL
ncbi:hypothetical protein CL616_04420 [archaeon]|nr:hypothetical protein [archaeon]|tara:strand:- start:533 stop:778 length:246 start_codon:yes stop_codon:yes gene_type:complete